MVSAALTAGHSVTLLTRGLTQPHLFPEAEHLVGDRDGGLDALAVRAWDAVVDTCGFVPRVVRQSAERLRADRYVFVSTVSVYADLSRPPGESSPVHPDPEGEDVGREYGALKAACERAIRESARGQVTVVRPGLIAGPHDPTGRFTYWPVRIADGGEVLAPAPPEAPAQVIDVRDLAAWLVRLAEAGPAGTFDAVGGRDTLRGVLDRVRRAVNPAARLVWVDPDALGGVTPWSELPLWLPGPQDAGMMAIDPGKAVAAGLRHLPVEETARDTLAWAAALHGEPPRQADGRYRVDTLSRVKERRILAAWRSRSPSRRA